MRKQPKLYTGEVKVAILRRHWMDKVPVSDLCDEHGLRPTVFYRWQKEFFENGATAFQGKRLVGSATDRVPREKDPDQRRVAGRINGRAYRLKKKPWGALTKVWVPHDVRDLVVDFVGYWSTNLDRNRPIHPLAGRIGQQVLQQVRALRARQAGNCFSNRAIVNIAPSSARPIIFVDRVGSRLEAAAAKVIATTVGAADCWTRPLG